MSIRTVYREGRKGLAGDPRGFTLIEVLIAMALVGIIAAAFLAGLTTASKAVLTADVRATAESLARTQMEHVKKLKYEFASPGEDALYPKIDGGDIPPGYTICSVDRQGIAVNCGPDDDIIATPWDSTNNAFVDSEKHRLQRIKLVIKHDDRVVYTLEGYKVER